MKCKRLSALLLGLALTAAVFPAWAEETEEPETPGEILVIYPEEMDRKADNDNLSALAQVLISLRYSADYVEAEKAGERISQYENVIWFAAADSERMNPAILRGFSGHLLALGRAEGLQRFGIRAIPNLPKLAGSVAEYTFIDDYPFLSSTQVMNPGYMPRADYKAGTLEIMGKSAPLVSARKNIRYIPLLDYTDAFAQAVLTQEIAQWLWPYESRMHTYTEYLVLDQLYPFSDPYRLREIVEYMVDKKMNFVLSVMPIYTHADYPAMQQFCEVLRFAQANGGSVILHAPIIQNGVDAEELAKRLTTAFKNYLSQDVYILGLEIPSEWLFRDDLRVILGRHKTLFISDMDAFSTQPVSRYGLKDYLNLGAQQITPALKLDETGVSHLTRCSTAVYLDISMAEDKQVYSVIDAVKDAPIPMQSLWDMGEAVYGNDEQYLLWEGDTLTVNGEQRFNVYSPREFEENFDYRRNVYYRFVANLAQQNYFLIGISSAVLMVFILLGFRSRRQMHKRFLNKTFTQKEENNVGG